MLSITPNYFAYAALLLWPFVSIWLFATRSVEKALLWSVLGGYLLLPVGTEIKFPGIPAFDKISIPSIIALCGCLMTGRKSAARKKGFGLPELFVGALLVGPFITSEFNSDPLIVGGIYGSSVLPGVGHYDALSASVAELTILLPFILGRRYLGEPEHSGLILRALTTAGVAYSIPMLLEVRLSPQLHAWIYGYFPHSFEQQIRDGGFRPVVFLGHGLPVAFFGMTAVVASIALWRCRARVLPVQPAVITLWLSSVLVLCKSLGSFVYAMALGPMVMFMKPRSQAMVASVLVALALTYPLLRATNLFPTGVILDLADQISGERQASLKFRFDQESSLLAHASERPWFGWGRFGRGRVYDDTGKDITVTDGHWIITLTTFGLFGFLAEFGLLAYTVFRTRAAIGFAPTTRDQLFIATLALVVGVGLVDLLPNATLNPTSWLFAGALLGQAETLLAYRVRKKRVYGEIGPTVEVVPNSRA